MKSKKLMMSVAALLIIATLLGGCVTPPMTVSVQLAETPAAAVPVIEDTPEDIPEAPEDIPEESTSRSVGRPAQFQSLRVLQDLSVAGPTTLSGVTTMTGAPTFQANPVFEGATADAYETTFAITDPTDDRTITFPNSSGTVAMAAYADTIEMEGATANDYEAQLEFLDPTADITITVPTSVTAAVMVSSLTTNGIGAANSVTGGSNALVFEGSVGNTYETSVSATNPTADRSVVLPNAGGTVVLSTLATNAPEVANSVTGASNSWVFEGVTGGDGFQTIFAPVDPTADNTVTIQNATGIMALTTGVVLAKTETYNAAATDTGKMFKLSGSFTVNLPAAVAGLNFCFVNYDGGDQVLDFTDATDVALNETNAPGDSVTNTTAYDHICLYAIDATNWVTLSSIGTWADGN